MKLPRRILSALFTVLVLCCIPLTAKAAQEGEYLLVDGRSLISNGVLQEFSYPAGVTYDEATDTLTLHNANIDYITATGSVNIHVTGDTTLGVEDTYGYSLRCISNPRDSNTARMNLKIDPGVTLKLTGSLHTKVFTGSANLPGEVVLSGGGMLAVEGSNNCDIVNEHGILRMDGWTTIFGSVSLPGDLTIAAGEVMFIDVGEVLTVGDGVTLTVNDLLTNNGTIALQGTGKVIANGIVADNGTVTVDGVPHTHSYTGTAFYEASPGETLHSKRTLCPQCPIGASRSGPEACTIGTATCTSPAPCLYCQDTYGEKDPDNHTSTETEYVSIDHSQHALRHSCCHKEISTGAHTIVDGTCTVCNQRFNVVITHGTATYGYNSFSTALAAAQKLDGCTVTLNRYSEVNGNGYNGYRVEKGNFTIDLNNCNISSTYNDTITVERNAKLTITDTSANGAGCIRSTNSFDYGLMINGGEVHIRGGHLQKAYSDDLYSAYLECGKLYLEGGTVDGISVNQSSSELYISGDASNSPQTCWIYFLQRNITDWLPRVQISQALTGDDTYTFRSEDVGNVVAGGIDGYALTAADAARFAYKDNSLIVTLNETDNTLFMMGNIAHAGITLDPAEYTYDGTAKTPAVAVKHNGKTLAENTDYTVSYGNNINAGTATVTITAKGNFTGTKEVTFSIHKAAAPAITFPTVENTIAYGQRIQELQLSFYDNAYGTFRWNAPTAISNAGQSAPALDFYPNELALQNYDWQDVGGASWIDSRKALCICPDVTINKADLKRTPPQPNELTYTGELQTLVRAGSWENENNALLSGSFLYSLEKNGNYHAQIPRGTGAGEYTLWYKPDNASANNYNDVGPWSVTVKVEKAVPDLTLPTELTATKGQTLQDVPLPTGWAWEDATASVGEVGAQTHKAVFTPTDTNNYHPAERDLTLVVCPDTSTLDNVTEETVTEAQKTELEALLEAVNTALEAEENLPDETAEQLKEDKQTLEALIAGLPPYVLTAGDGSQWTKGGAGDLTFTANGHFARFTGIKVDGNAVAADNYTASSGSTKITLKAAYLETLSRGEHTIAVCYSDGTATGTFTITRTGGSPDTADPARPMLFLCLMTLSTAALYLTRRKRKDA